MRRVSDDEKRETIARRRRLVHGRTRLRVAGIVAGAEGDWRCASTLTDDLRRNDLIRLRESDSPRHTEFRSSQRRHRPL